MNTGICPFDSSMMARFRQRITPKMLAWVNDQIIGRKAEQDKHDVDDSSKTGGQADETRAAKAEREQRMRTKGSSFWMRPVRRRISAFLQTPPCWTRLGRRPKGSLTTSMKWDLPKGRNREPTARRLAGSKTASPNPEKDCESNPYNHPPVAGIPEPGSEDY